MIGLKEKTLSFVRSKGPVLPIQVKNEIGRDLFFSGAILSELVSEKQIKISHAKIGSSPLYYFEGQEEKLSRLYDGLPMREKEAYDLLKTKKVLKDKEVGAAIRVALREIKDFAIPFTINKEGGQEIIWKWHLVPNQEIRSYLKEEKFEKKREVQKTIVKEPQREIERKEERPAKIKTRKIQTSSELSRDIAGYLKKNDIRLLEETLVRRNREFDLIVSIPSNIGSIEYLINVKNKKTINEADLTLAYQKGQSRKLAVILLTTGELTKKAKLYREKNLKGYVLVKKL